jgi:hypothetical protein
VSLVLPSIIKGPVLELEPPASVDPVDLIITNVTTGRSLTIEIPAGWGGGDLTLDFAALLVTDSGGVDRSSFVSPADHGLWTSQPMIGGVNDLTLKARDGREGTAKSVLSAGPGTVVEDATVGTKAWSLIEGVKVEDGQIAGAPMSGGPVTTKFIKATDYGFALPEGGTGVTIEGVEALIKRGTESGGIVDADLYLVKGGAIKTATTNKASTNAWPRGHADVEGKNATGLLTATYGGPTDLWGNTLSPADVISNGIGLAFACKTGPSGNGVALIDVMKLRIYYAFVAAAVDYAANATLRWRAGYV